MLNGNAVLEKAAEGDARVKIEGDIQLLIQPLHRHPRYVESCVCACVMIAVLRPLLCTW